MSELARADRRRSAPCLLASLPWLAQDYYESLEQSLQGGVTIVQIREKDTDTGEFYSVALWSKEICDKVR